MALPSASPGNVLGAGSHEPCSESLGMRELLSLISVGTVTNQVLLSLGGCRKPWASPCAPGSPRTSVPAPLPERLYPDPAEPLEFPSDKEIPERPRPCPRLNSHTRSSLEAFQPPWLPRHRG